MFTGIRGIMQMSLNEEQMLSVITRCGSHGALQCSIMIVVGFKFRYACGPMDLQYIDMSYTLVSHNLTIIMDIYRPSYIAFHFSPPCSISVWSDGKLPSCIRISQDLGKSSAPGGALFFGNGKSLFGVKKVFWTYYTENPWKMSWWIWGVVTFQMFTIYIKKGMTVLFDCHLFNRVKPQRKIGWDILEMVKSWQRTTDGILVGGYWKHMVACYQYHSISINQYANIFYD